MPHIDLRRLFSAPSDAAPPPEQSDLASQSKVVGDVAGQNNGVSFVRITLGRGEWITIIFVAVTFIGGLSCVFRFSNGPEIWRSVTAWPREFLYPRPSPAARGAKVDTSSHVTAQEAPLTAQSMRLSDRGENPPHLSAGSVNPSPSLTAPGPGNTNFSSGSGGSSSSPTQASRSSPAHTPASHSTHGTGSSAMHDAHRTVVVVTTHVSAEKKHHSEQIKEKTHQAKEAATKSAGCKQTHQSSQHTSPVTHATKTQAASAIRSTNNLGHQMLGTARGFNGNPGSSFRGGAGFSGGGHH
jgi:hypothetical protein